MVKKRKVRQVMAAGEIYEKVVEIVADVLSLDEEQKAEITPDTSINLDLGADSLDGSEILMQLEDEFGETLPDAVLEKPNVTIGELVEVVETFTH